MRTSASQTAGAAGNNQIGMLVLVYAAIAQDLCRAGHRLAAGNTPIGCDIANHALTLLGHMQGWKFGSAETALAQSVEPFYVYLRSQVTRLLTDGTAEDFFKLSALVSQEQTLWQQQEARLRPASRKDPARQTPTREIFGQHEAVARLSFQA